jgi:hypothetical protein
MKQDFSELYKDKVILIGITIFIAGLIFVGELSVINTLVASSILFWLIAKWANLPKSDKS